MDKPISLDALAFLKKNFVAVLATSYLNLPYASIIYYTVDDAFNLYFVTKTNTDKYLNLKVNRNVALAIGDSPNHISVQVRGHVTVLKDKKRRMRVINDIESKLKKENIEIWPIKKIRELQTKKKDLDEEVVYKVIPQHLVFTNLDDESLPNSIGNNRHNIIPSPKK